MNKFFFRTFLILFFLFVTFLLKLNVLAKSVDFIIEDGLGRDNVSFTSDAPIELIVGRTTKIKGKITLDDSLDLKKQPIKAFFEVDLVSIDTGIPLRNEHMRDNFLETKKFPKANFTLNMLLLNSDSKLSDGKSVNFTAKGSFTVHGVTVKKDIPIKVIYFKESDFTHSKFEHGDVIKIQSSFNVPLAEHKIKRPEIIFQKLADTVIVSVDAYGNLPVKK